MMKIQMPRVCRLCLAFFLVLPHVVCSEQLEPYTGSEVTEFVLPDLSGKARSLADYRGKVVLVNFWASWCTPCVQEMPELSQLKQLLADRPFEILAVNVGEHENRVKHFAKRTAYHLPVLLDISRDIFAQWNIEIMPTSFLIDGTGHVRYRALGNPGWDNEQTLALIENLVKETLQSGSVNR